MILGKNAENLVGRYFKHETRNNIYRLYKDPETGLFKQHVILHQERDRIGKFLDFYPEAEWYVVLLEDHEVKPILRSVANKKKAEFDLIPNRIFL